MNTQSPVRRHQGGFTLLGLVFWGVVIAFLGYVAVSVLPVINEYLTIQRTVDKIAASPPPTVNEIRTAFERQKEIEYAIQSVSGRDLDIAKVNDRVVISYSYQKEVPLSGPVYLLLKFKGRSK